MLRCNLSKGCFGVVLGLSFGFSSYASTVQKVDAVKQYEKFRDSGAHANKLKHSENDQYLEKKVEKVLLEIKKIDRLVDDIKQKRLAKPGQYEDNPVVFDNKKTTRYSTEYKKAPKTDRAAVVDEKFQQDPDLPKQKTNNYRRTVASHAAIQLKQQKFGQFERVNKNSSFAVKSRFLNIGTTLRVSTDHALKNTVFKNKF